jgi:hypothetical protein
MNTKVQVRLDRETNSLLRSFVKKSGKTTSEVLRRGIQLAVNEERLPASMRMMGIGCVDFGPGDLATNKKHLEGFGKKWRMDKNGRGRWDW